jgi:hypothetical protein
MREVEIIETGQIGVLECYTLRETGAALGRSLLTIRSWLKNELFPAPALRATGTGYPQFCREELDVAARILARHEKFSRYLSATHESTITQLHEAMDAVRGKLIDSFYE